MQDRIEAGSDAPGARERQAASSCLQHLRHSSQNREASETVAESAIARLFTGVDINPSHPRSGPCGAVTNFFSGFPAHLPAATPLADVEVHAASSAFSLIGQGSGSSGCTGWSRPDDGSGDRQTGIRDLWRTIWRPVFRTSGRHTSNACRHMGGTSSLHRNVRTASGQTEIPR
jgi:hypothetical protein